MQPGRSSARGGAPVRGEVLQTHDRRTFGIVCAVAGLISLFLAPSAEAVVSTTPVDVASDAGIYEKTTSWSVAVTDVDGDGSPDFFLGRHREVGRLYLNGGSHFTEVDANLFTSHDRHGCAWADVDQDGRPDLYCSVGAVHGTIAKKNQLWIQQPDGTFVDQAEVFGVTDPYGRGRDVTFIDVNHDVYPDLFVGNQYPRQDDHRSPNRLFINKGGTHFRQLKTSLTRQLGARCAQAADVDGDGWQDLLVCGKQGRGLHLYRNRHGRSFRDVTGSYGIGGDSRSAQLVDVDGDGDLDLVSVDPRSLHVQLQRRGRFRRTVYRRSLDHALWLAVGDIDRDSRPDIYVVRHCKRARTNVPDVMLRNDGSGKAFTEIKIPEADGGCGTYAAPIDYDGNGATDFIVLNGSGVLGPVQLISFP
jgi:hypothetical protein